MQLGDFLIWWRRVIKGSSLTWSPLSGRRGFLERGRALIRCVHGYGWGRAYGRGPGGAGETRSPWVEVSVDVLYAPKSRDWMSVLPPFSPLGNSSLFYHCGPNYRPLTGLAIGIYCIQPDWYFRSSLAIIVVSESVYITKYISTRICICIWQPIFQNAFSWGSFYAFGLAFVLN